jgi:hypothetical protein
MATKVIKARIQILSKTAAQLAAENPVLLLGEPSRETDTGVEKIGDGVTAYIDLPVKPGSVDGADGADGVDGNDGVDGLSAYQIAVANGFVGNEAAWLVSLQGDDGNNGVDGVDGTDGADGVDGADGLSAYQIAVANGFVGNEAAWLVSLQGDDGNNGVDGVDGTDGADGVDGADGLSAYQIAVANGFVGNEAAWLVSLQGDDGAAASIGDVGGLTEALDDRMRGTVRLTVSAIPPASPSVNDLWIETS